MSVPYRLIVAGRNVAYNRGWFATKQAELPVVSIGNLSVGGTGKSPLVAWVAGWFRQRDLRVAILSRGYGELDSGQNDEALELELRLPDVPHLQHRNRVASARLAHEELDMQVLVLDDGFQHRRLRRDLDIVLIDATDPPRARHLLPAGLLREPAGGLCRADFIIMTRVDQATEPELAKTREWLQRNAPGVPVLQASHRPSQLWLHPQEKRSLEELRGRRVLAFCGIGNPDSFFQSLESLGAELVDRRVFPDHHPYNASDVDSLVDWGRTQAPALMVCTLKDWVKLQTRYLGNMELAALIIDFHFVGETLLLEEALGRLVPETLDQ